MSELQIPISTVFLVILRLICTYQLITQNDLEDTAAGLPEVTCATNAVRVRFTSKHPFEGNIYAKGFYMIPGCRVSGHDDAISEIVFGFGDVECGMKRVRTMNPVGMSVEITVVISFHPSFITKVDRAYRVSCFYMEAEKSVTQDLIVSMMTTQMVTQRVNMPVCKYEILSESINGEPVSFGRVGDKVYHKWSCETPKPELFCLTVHSCFVDNAAGDPPVLVIDERGSDEQRAFKKRSYRIHWKISCAVDKHLIDNLEYLDNLLVAQESHVFKFADKPSVVFNCQLRLSINDMKSCGSLIPRCYSKRSVEARNVQPEEYVTFDFQPTALAVADPQTSVAMPLASGQRFLTLLPSNHICITWLGISSLMGVVFFALCGLLGTILVRFDGTTQRRFRSLRAAIRSAPTAAVERGRQVCGRLVNAR